MLKKSYREVVNYKNQCYYENNNSIDLDEALDLVSS